MAVFEFRFFSDFLRRPVPVKMILPNDPQPWHLDHNKAYDRPVKTLFLLHGYNGDDNDWVYGSDVSDFAFRNNVAVVMPTGDNSFYLDGKATGSKYCSFICKELVQYVRKTFGLATKMEDTFIGGFSMGGFGAIHALFSEPETFNKGIGLSSAYIVHTVAKLVPGQDNGIANYEYYEQVFGDLKKVGETENNPEVLVKKLVKEGRRIPKLFMAVGTEDFLLNENRAARDALIKEGVSVDYFESKGCHNMVFWNEYLKKGIEWMLND